MYTFFRRHRNMPSKVIDADGNINLNSLQKELNASVEYEKRYRQRDDAKKRAMYQKVATYEEFTSIVAASHLDPINKQQSLNDGDDCKTTTALGIHRKATEASTALTHGLEIIATEPNKSMLPMDFIKAWLRVKDRIDEKYALLAAIDPPSQLARFIMADTGFGLAEDCIITLSEVNDDVITTNGERTMALLHALSTIDRFELFLSFLGNKEKTALLRLFHQLSSVYDTVALRKVFGI